jgi:hypothetical protein
MKKNILSLSQLPQFGIATFNSYHSDDIERRNDLNYRAQNFFTMSLYEALHLDPNELMAFAVRQDQAAQARKMLGMTADYVQAEFGSRVYSLGVPLSEPIEEWTITRSSPYRFVVEITSKSSGVSAMIRQVVPLRILFSEKAVAQFARQELLAYAHAPDVRR